MLCNFQQLHGMKNHDQSCGLDRCVLTQVNAQRSEACASSLALRLLRFVFFVFLHLLSPFAIFNCHEAGERRNTCLRRTCSSLEN